MKYFAQSRANQLGLDCPVHLFGLRGCPLRCHYCDTSYAFHEGEKVSIQDILDQVKKFATNVVEITGGEPLIQPNVHPLMCQLLEQGYEVLLETSGERDLSFCDARICRIIDIKTPNSGAADSFMESNYEVLTQKDEVKFVIMDREDFDWAIDTVQQYSLINSVKAVHFSPVMEQESNAHIQGCESLNPIMLSNWILESNLPIRMHLQLHKYIWSPLTRGV